MTPRPIARQDIISSRTVQVPSRSWLVTQAPTMPSSPKASRSRTAATSVSGAVIKAVSSASATACPAELNCLVRAASSCSRGTSAMVAAAMVTSVPAEARNSSRLPPKACSAACRWRRAAYISPRLRASSVTAAAPNSGQPAASATSSGASTSTSGSSAPTSARS